MVEQKDTTSDPAITASQATAATAAKDDSTWGITSIQDTAKRADAMVQNKEKLLGYIRENVIGSNHNTLLRTVYGEKPHVYCDYTASGKSLRFIEDYITR